MHATYSLKINSLPADKLEVLAFTGTEGISQLFQFHIDVGSLDHNLDLVAQIGQPAVLTIHGREAKRYVHGLVNVFEQTGRQGKWTLYRLELVPAISTLRLRETCRIFAKATISDIIRRVLTDAGIGSDQFRISVKQHEKNTRPYPYRIQYGESDFAFICRLMEECGIFYFFEHAQNNHVLIIADEPSAHGTITGPANVLFRQQRTAGVADKEHVSTYRYNHCIRSTAVRTKDFDFKKPGLNLEKTCNAKGNGKYEVYSYPGKSLQPPIAEELAKLRLEELRATEQMGRGESDCCRLTAGYRFKLSEHPRGDFNKEYMLLSVRHRGAQAQALGADVVVSEGAENSYTNAFECIPSTVPFRPARVTPRPRIQGPQTAIVVGPEGEEIYTDEHACVKVKFHWDRSDTPAENNPIWVRVTQAWAGPTWGGVFIPRVGQEVLVEFLEGDPDRPIVTGAVYNGDNRPPYTLPDQKTKTALKSNSSPGGGGSNEFRFEDAKGSEEVYLHGQKDLTVAIENNKNQTVGNDESLTITNNRTKTVQVDESETIGANKTIKVGATHNESIGSTMTLTVGGNRTETIGMADAESIVLAKALTIGAAYQVSVGAGMNETVGGAKAEEIGGAKAVVVGAVSTEKIGGNKSTDAGSSITEKAGKDIGMTAGNDLTASAGKKLVLNAGDQITIKTGSASITMKSNGDITICGKNIKIKADSDIVMKAQNILQN